MQMHGHVGMEGVRGLRKVSGDGLRKASFGSLRRMSGTKINEEMGLRARGRSPASVTGEEGMASLDRLVSPGVSPDGGDRVGQK